MNNPLGYRCGFWVVNKKHLDPQNLGRCAVCANAII